MRSLAPREEQARHVEVVVLLAIATGPRRIGRLVEPPLLREPQLWVDEQRTLADRFGSRDTRWFLWIVTVALVLSVPPTVMVFLSADPYAALAWFILPVFLGNVYQATTFSQTQGLVELRMRAVAAAVLLFILNIIGLGLGPQIVGVLSDLLAPQFAEHSLRYSLLICGLVNVWAAYHYYVAGKYLRADLDSAAADH